MDHAEARERLELAAVEPGGLDRLMAGDTPESAAVAGHLAGCASCQEELRRLHLAAGVIREAVRSTPPADLRERTLAYVAALGRDRASGRPAEGRGAASVPGSVPASTHPSIAGRRPPVTARWLAALAAAVVLAVAGTAFVVSGQRNALIAERDAQLAERAEDVAALERVTVASLRVASQADAANVPLEGTGAQGAETAWGTLAFSPRTRELVVIASGLERPPDGQEFRCWVESRGDRRPVGRMYFAQDLAFWVGEVAAVGDLERGSTFGVSLVNEDADVREEPPALLGGL